MAVFRFFAKSDKYRYATYIGSYAKRYFSFKIERLKSRAIIKVSGEGVYTFMQGLITNDIRHLDYKRSIYSMFLNNKGRVLYDSILYKPDDEDNNNNHQSLLVECDSKILNDLKNHLTIFRVRRKINIEPSTDKLWVIYNENDADNVGYLKTEHFKAPKISENVLCSGLTNNKEDRNYEAYLNESVKDERIKMYTDPRLNLLGVRVIVPENINILEIVKKNFTDMEITENSYIIFRYKLGIGEGVEELIPGNCFPLEMNCDYLHGVSFHKGCYIGQELTARVHHTGVVRKRLMPLVILEDELNSQLSFDSTVMTSNGGKNVGKLKGLRGPYGIGLLRINEVLDASARLKINDVLVSTYKPSWWPKMSKKGTALISEE